MPRAAELVDQHEAGRIRGSRANDFDMRSWFRENSILILAAAGILTATSALADWPQANGPNGNFNPAKAGAALVDDLKEVRRIWVNSEADLGFAKGSSSGFVRHLTEADTHPGAASGMIVAEGRLFASSFRPAGEKWVENLPHLQHEKNSVYLADPEKAAALRRNGAIVADDFTVAIDGETGRTLWRAVEKGRGLNRYSGKRNHFGVTPAYHDGRVFSFGTMGVLYCYEAKSGRKLWENTSGSLVAVAKAEREQLLEERSKFAGGDGMSVSLVVADGVLVAPQFTGATEIGLRGVDVNSGETRWEVSAATNKYATPAVWSHGDRQYLLCATLGGHGKFDAGVLRLIDPKSGKVMWAVDGLAPTWYPLAPSKDHVLVNVPSDHINPKKRKDGQPWGLMAAYRITPEKTERAWTMPDKPQFWFENHFDICAKRRALIRDGRVYFFGQGYTMDPQRSSRFFSILDEQSGRVLYTTEALTGSPQFWLVENRLLVMPDASHSNRSTLELYDPDPASFRQLGESWKPPHENTTAYETYMELPIVDGRIFMRDRKGQVICYDLGK